MDYAEKDREEFELCAILFYLINQRLNNATNDGPSEQEIIDILTNRIRRLNIPNIQNAATWSEIGEVLTKHLQKNECEKNSIDFQFSFIGIDEPEVFIYCDDHNLDFREYVFRIGMTNLICIDPQYEKKMEDYNIALSEYTTAIEEGQEALKPTLPHPYVKSSDNSIPSKTMFLSDNLLVSNKEEISCIIVFRDQDFQEVDWKVSLERLKDYVISHRYSKKQTTACLLRLISTYNCNEYELLKDYDDPNEIAKALLKYESKIPEKLKFMSALKNSRRKPHECIEKCMAKIEGLLKKIYSNADIYEDEKCQDILLSALIQFTIGEVKNKLEKEVTTRKSQGLYCNYNTLLEKVSQQESYDVLLRPKTELSFEVTKKIGIFNINLKQEEIEAYNSITMDKECNSKQTGSRQNEITPAREKDNKQNNCSPESRSNSLNKKQSRSKERSEDRKRRQRSWSPESRSNSLNNQSLEYRRDSLDKDEPRSRKQYRDQDKRHYNQSLKYKDDSLDRKQPRSRSDSLDRNQPKSKRRSSDYKSKFWGKADNSRDILARQRRQNDQSPTSRNDRNNRYRSYSRDESYYEPSLISIYEKFKNYNPGYNCRQDYNPRKTGKVCLKCFTQRGDRHSHFEFDCTKYKKIADKNCKICKRGFHLESECKRLPI